MMLQIGEEFFFFGYKRLPLLTPLLLKHTVSEDRGPGLRLMRRSEGF